MGDGPSLILSSAAGSSFSGLISSTVAIGWSSVRSASALASFSSLDFSSLAAY
jgi:hypothetical protein